MQALFFGASERYPASHASAVLSDRTMIKLVYCITRRPDLSVAEFSRYWHDVHGPLGRQIPGLRRLVQSHPLAFERSDFDGMAELWFDDLAALDAARQSDQWRASSADEANFIDATRTALFLTQEREIE
jgi:uncharacterized protein (TIGR02118 family)